MLKTIVIYRSISGFTKKYATWIAEELNADLCNAKKIDAEKLCKYEFIIFGGSLHAAGINGIKIIKENLPQLADKKIIVFVVGASPSREGVLEEIRKRNFSEEEQKSIKFFYLRGGFNFSKLDRPNKILMALFRVKLSMKRNKTPDERGMLAAYSKPIDCTIKENIEGIIEYAKSLA